jgi:hypothetical protein
MTTRKILLALAGLLVMGLPAVAGRYYYARVAPRIDATAAAEQALPGNCGTLDRQLHKALMQAVPPEILKTAEADREKGIRMCAYGSEKNGVYMLQTALRDLGLRPST